MSQRDKVQGTRAASPVTYQRQGGSHWLRQPRQQVSLSISVRQHSAVMPSCPRNPRLADGVLLSEFLVRLNLLQVLSSFTNTFQQSHNTVTSLWHKTIIILATQIFSRTNG